MRTISRHALLSALLAGALLPSCQLEPYELPAEELYTRSFIKQFGVIDKNQDWNLAERKSVTVNPGSADQVKVYAYVGNTKYIFANYSDVKGTQTLEFDLPEGVEDIIVKVNGVEKTTKVGGSVDFSGGKTRAVTTHDNEDGILTVTKGDWYELEPERVLEYRTHLPEKERNVDKYTQNFLFVNNGDFVIYPIYYNTSRTNTVGIYVKDESGNITHYPISAVKSGGEIAYATDCIEYEKEEAWLCCLNYGVMKENWKINTNFQDYTNEDEEYLRQAILTHADDVKGWVHFTGEIKEVTAVEYPGQWSNNETTYTQYGTTEPWHPDACIRVRVSTGEGGKAYTWNDINGGQESYDESKEYIKFRSRGIKIHMKEGVKFGMYISVGGGKTYYSEQELNPDPLKAGDTDTNSERACHAVTYLHDVDDGKQYRILAFEDWDNSIAGEGASDMDLNDMVFYITSENIERIPGVEGEDKPQPFAWLVACEDLGDTGDIDFNDIVFKVEYTSGEEKAVFTPLATGATLESCVYYKDIPVGGDGDDELYKSEIHKLLGGSAPNFINTTDNRGSDSNKSKISLNVGKEFSMAYIGEEGKTEQNMGNFVIKTFGREKNTSTGWGAVTIVSGSDKGDAPMMICLPYEYEKEGKTYKWAWPKERVSIKEAYSEFEQWVENSSYTDWYKYPNDGYVVTDPQGSSVTTTKTTK